MSEETFEPPVTIAQIEKRYAEIRDPAHAAIQELISSDPAYQTNIDQIIDALEGADSYSVRSVHAYIQAKDIQDLSHWESSPSSEDTFALSLSRRMDNRPLKGMLLRYLIDDPTLTVRQKETLKGYFAEIVFHDIFQAFFHDIDEHFSIHWTPFEIDIGNRVNTGADFIVSVDHVNSEVDQILFPLALIGIKTRSKANKRAAKTSGVSIPLAAPVFNINLGNVVFTIEENEYSLDQYLDIMRKSVVASKYTPFLGMQPSAIQSIYRSLLEKLNFRALQLYQFFLNPDTHPSLSRLSYSHYDLIMSAQERLDILLGFFSHYASQKHSTFNENQA